MKNRTLPAVLIAGIALTTILAGCTATGAGSDTKPTDKPAASEQAADTADAPTTNECIDGTATIIATADNAPISLPDGCETVYIVASNQTINLGPTVNLLLEGTGNTITYTGDEPTITGTTDGDNNTITPNQPTND